MQEPLPVPSASRTKSDGAGESLQILLSTARKKSFSQSFTSAPTHPKSTRTKERSHRKETAQHKGGDSSSLQALPHVALHSDEADEKGLLPPGNHGRAHQQQADSGCLTTAGTSDSHPASPRPGGCGGSALAQDQAQPPAEALDGAGSQPSPAGCAPQTPVLAASPEAPQLGARAVTGGS